MSTEPEAIRLANEGEFRAGLLRQGPPEWCAELRRLHAQSLADEELMREARDALQYHVEQTRPIDRTSAALSRLRQRIGE